MTEYGLEFPGYSDADRPATALRITEDGTVLSGVQVYGIVEIDADNVEIHNVGCHGVRATARAKNFRIGQINDAVLSPSGHFELAGFEQSAPEEST